MLIIINIRIFICESLLHKKINTTQSLIFKVCIFGNIIYFEKQGL